MPDLLSGYTPIYVRSDGDNSDGLTPETAFTSAQSAFDLTYGFGSGDYVIDLGIGSFGGVVLSAGEWPVRIAVRGVGYGSSDIGGITYPPGGGSVAIIGNNTATLGNITLDGIGVDGDGDGNNGGNVNLTNITCGNISVNGFGGNAGGNGGLVTLNGASVGTISSNGGEGLSLGYSNGSGGNITLISNSIASSISSNGGANGSNSDGGTVSITNSAGGDISTVGGTTTTSFRTCGAGGTITLNNAVVGNIISNSGESSDTNSYGASAGNVIVISSTTNNINASGGNTALGGGNAGTISVSTTSNVGVVTSAPGTQTGGDGSANGSTGTINITSSTANGAMANGGIVNITTSTINGDVSATAVALGDGGLIIIIGSVITNNVTSNGGDGNESSPSGNGGNITITSDSTFVGINVLAGNDGGFGVGTKGVFRFKDVTNTAYFTGIFSPSFNYNGFAHGPNNSVTNGYPDGWDSTYYWIGGSQTTLDQTGCGAWNSKAYHNAIDIGIVYATYSSDSHTFNKTTVSVVKGGVTLTVDLPQLDIVGTGML